jgi:hypothetical protein
MDKQAHDEKVRLRKIKKASQIDSNEMIIAGLAHYINYFEPGERTFHDEMAWLSRYRRRHLWTARRMLKIRCVAKGCYILPKYFRKQLYKFGLMDVIWSTLNPDFNEKDQTILLFSDTHADLILRVKSFLRGEQVDPCFGCYTPKKETLINKFNSLEASKLGLKSIQDKRLNGIFD